MASAALAAPAPDVDLLAGFVRAHPRLVVLTGAGCSTASGIPEYRDHDGAWKNRPPVRHAEFVESAAVRRRYWGRSLAGWERVASAQPNATHHALARLEEAGHVELLVTQNVDGLHQKARSRRVLDLHGRLDRVECLSCAGSIARQDLQELLLAWNPGFAPGAGAVPAAPRPDGDTALERDFSAFRVPDCPSCGGVLKPGVVLFGDSVPATRVERVLQALEASDALLVVGSSLMVFSGYRFCTAARALGKPVGAVNLGRTRADELLAFKVAAECGRTLQALAQRL